MVYYWFGGYSALIRSITKQSTTGLVIASNEILHQLDFEMLIAGLVVIITLLQDQSWYVTGLVVTALWLNKLPIKVLLGW
jgi:hypothetical protein